MDQIDSIYHLVSLTEANGYLKAINAPKRNQNPIDHAHYHHWHATFPTNLGRSRFNRLAIDLGVLALLGPTQALVVIPTGETDLVLSEGLGLGGSYLLRGRTTRLDTIAGL